MVVVVAMAKGSGQRRAVHSCGGWYLCMCQCIPAGIRAEQREATARAQASAKAQVRAKFFVFFHCQCTSKPSRHPLCGLLAGERRGTAGAAPPLCGSAAPVGSNAWSILLARRWSREWRDHYVYKFNPVSSYPYEAAERSRRRWLYRQVVKLVTNESNAVTAKILQLSTELAVSQCRLDHHEILQPAVTLSHTQYFHVTYLHAQTRTQH